MVIGHHFIGIVLGNLCMCACACTSMYACLRACVYVRA